MALGLVGLTPPPRPGTIGEVTQGSASISARVTVMVATTVTVPITIATPMATVLAGGTITVIGTSGSFI